MGFLDDLSGGIGQILNPVQDGLSQLNLGMPALGNALGIQNNFQAVNPISAEQMQQGIQGGFGAVNAQNALAQQLASGAGNIYQQQLDLGNALRQQAAGQGPNPAQAMLANATGQNVANQAALMAGQRGAGANVGMIARQAGQQGAGIQQQAAGQAASLQAQQQLAAQQQLQQQQQAMQQNALQAQGAATQAALGHQGNLLNYQTGVNQANADVAAGNAKRNAGLIGGLISGAADVLPFMFSQGGQVPEHLAHISNIYHGGGKVDAMVSPGEGYVKPDDAQKVADGKKHLKAVTKEIPGKAKVEGDSQKNDTVHAKLDAGGVVIPRSIMEKGEKHAVDFLKDALRKGSDKKEHSDFHSALKRAISSRGK